MRRIIAILSFVLLLSSAQSVLADEGMWMINTINAALERQMKDRGLKLDAGEIYNEGQVSLSDAIVSLDFGCSGSFISERGLVITNHHCAYADIFALSTAEKNYLEDGFWAFRDIDEIPIKGKGVQVLKKVLDVTQEIAELKKKYAEQGRQTGFRRLSYLLEKKYKEETGFEASLTSMWSGSKYYMALYEDYRDVRLVAAPPVSIGAFGGDIDNWEWPQHKCDFAIYRVYCSPDGKPADYSADNVPLKPARTLKISTAGYAPGDFAMVIGYPGHTNRYSSSAKIKFEEEISLPVSSKIRGEQMEIMSKWMNADDNVRLKYSSRFFSVSNVRELDCGETECFKRFKVFEEKKALEKELAEWIASDEKRKTRWGTLLGDLEESYSAVTDIERNLSYLRETLLRGSFLSIFASRISNASGGAEKERMTKKNILKDLKNIDIRVEKDLTYYAIKTYLENVSQQYWGEYQKEMWHSYGAPDALAEAIWQGSALNSEEGLMALVSEKTELRDYAEDPLVKFFQDVKIKTYNEERGKVQGKKKSSDLEREYTHVLYQMRKDKGIFQYPDANSTMRLSYGTVGGFSPRDGVELSYKTTTDGILEKCSGFQYEFKLKPEWQALLLSLPKGSVNVDFLTDNDITGGNSGSAVLNARGELIGLAFDGNKESLAGDASYTPGYNHCINVDIRFVLLTLERYAGLGRILEEILK